MSIRGASGGASARSDIWLAGLGLLSESNDRSACQNASGLTTQAVFYMAVPLRAGDLISNGHLIVIGAGSGLTLSKMGLYSTAGVRLALSADQGVAWQSGGMKTAAMLSAFRIVTSGIYYVAVLAVGTGMPTLARAIANSTILQGAVAGGVPLGAEQAGQADLPDPGVIAGGATQFWVGVS